MNDKEHIHTEEKNKKTIITKTKGNYCLETDNKKTLWTLIKQGSHSKK